MKQIMKDTACLDDVAFSVYHVRELIRPASPLISLICEEILFFLNAVNSLAIKHCIGTNHNVL